MGRRKSRDTGTRLDEGNPSAGLGGADLLTILLVIVLLGAALTALASDRRGLVASATWNWLSCRAREISASTAAQRAEASPATSGGESQP